MRYKADLDTQKMRQQEHCHMWRKEIVEFIFNIEQGMELHMCIYFMDEFHVSSKDLRYTYSC